MVIARKPKTHKLSAICRGSVFELDGELYMRCPERNTLGSGYDHYWVVNLATGEIDTWKDDVDVTAVAGRFVEDTKL